VDVTTLIAGPAQAGSKPPVGKPGAGCTAGAGSAAAAGAAPDHGFASLVEAALDPQGGVSTSRRGATGEGAGGDAGTDAGRDDVSSIDAAAGCLRATGSCRLEGVSVSLGGAAGRRWVFRFTSTRTRSS